MKKLKYPPHVQWEVTPECNHNCIHCYNYWRKEEPDCKRKEFHSEEDYISIAKKLIEQKVNTVVITGGEPFLVFEKVIPAIDILLKNGIKVSINTNAVLVDDDIINYLLKNKIRLFISFPSANSEICDQITNIKGSAKRIIKSLDNLLSKGVNFGLNIVVSKINIDDVEETVKFLKERYQIPRINITRVGKPVNSDDSFNKYFLDRRDISKLQEISVNIHKNLQIDVDSSCPYTPCSIETQEAFDLFGYRKMCTAGKTTFSIGFDGSVKACPRDSKSYGNIFSEKFENIWNEMEEWRDDSLLPKECKNCKEKRSCQGGCRVDGYPFTGKRNSMDSIANLDNLPIKFKVRDRMATKFNEQNKFKVADNLNIVQEEFGYRISKMERYIYATEELKDFLISKDIFSIEDIKEVFDVNFDVANSVINRLVYCGIVIKLQKGENERG